MRLGPWPSFFRVILVLSVPDRLQSVLTYILKSLYSYGDENEKSFFLISSSLQSLVILYTPLNVLTFVLSQVHFFSSKVKIFPPELCVVVYRLVVLITREKGVERSFNPGVKRPCKKNFPLLLKAAYWSVYVRMCVHINMDTYAQKNLATNSDGFWKGQKQNNYWPVSDVENYLLFCGDHVVYCFCFCFFFLSILVLGMEPRDFLMLRNTIWLSYIPCPPLNILYQV
jgi:hypothetical protein